MNTSKPRKRLSLDLQTLRTLQSDELARVEGGAAGEQGGQQAAIGISITVSWGGNCNCCKGGAA
jgi:hypothetical protein